MVFNSTSGMVKAFFWQRKILPSPLCCLYFIATLYLSGAKLASAQIVSDSRTPDALLIENEKISMKISDRLFLEPALKKDGRLVSFVSRGPAEKPAFYIRVGGLLINDFRIDWDRLEKSGINDELGRGVRYLIRAEAEQYAEFLYTSLRLDAELSLSFYEKFPTVVVSSFKVTNRGDCRLEIDEVASNFYRLDRKLLEPERSSWEFASYQGASTRWGRDYSLIWVTPDFNRRNFMGMSELVSSEVAGGGTPLIDLWTPECGLALASAETEQQWISLPVQTAPDGLVEISVTETPDTRLGQVKFLAPGASYSTIRTALILHELDFYNSIGTYADLLRARGVKIPLASPPQAYEPYWKSWGLRKDFTLEQIYKALKQLRKIGIRWANLDDGWFTFYGDWEPNPAPGKFPGGEADMIAFVDRIHREGFKTSLWWYPQGVSPRSRLAGEHPDWLVQNEDGTLPLSKRGLYYLCPVHPECIGFIERMVRKIMVDWGFDGLYIDAQDLAATPPCFNPAHNHASPLDSFRKQPVFYRAIYQTAQEIKPGCPIEMCICAMPHDPFKMPYYNVANSSDPVNLEQVTRRVKVEKAYRGPTFCVGDCYQVPLNEWEGFSVPESFEAAVGSGAQVTTFFTNLTPAQERKWKRWIGKYREMGLAWSDYLGLYDIAFDKPEAHVVRKGEKLYYGLFARHWSVGRPIELRGLAREKNYRVRDYANGIDLGTLSGDNPVIYRAFKDNLLLEVSPLK